MLESHSHVEPLPQTAFATPEQSESWVHALVRIAKIKMKNCNKFKEIAYQTNPNLVRKSSCT